MTESVYVNADLSKVVEEGSPEAAYRIHAKEAKRLGLLKERKTEVRASTNGTPRRTKTDQ